MFGFGKKKKNENYRGILNQAIQTIKEDAERFVSEHAAGEHKRLTTLDDFVGYLSPRFRTYISFHEAGNNMVFDKEHVRYLLSGGVESVRKKIPF